ncbi:YqjF family protein [uncultured Amnibacterium sp.]|uniref:YqjF family protein n=1 Tax=uncultured Amnibacterium sp. TaxID=1631851 RepID=UPI0035CADD4B
MVHEVEALTAVAPPLPGRAFIRQHWRDAVFLHWRVDPAIVRPLLPPGTRADTTPDGATWVGLIPFVLERTAFPPLPVVPWLGTFLETNVRLYSVDEQGRRGVVFRTLEAQHLLPVLAANAGLGLPYRWARMRSSRRDRDLAYASERLTGTRARTRIRIRTRDEALRDDPLADFLTARWAMHVGRFGRTAYYRNQHEPWLLFRAELLELRDELLADSGLPGLALREPDSVLYSPGVTTTFSLPAEPR